MFGYKTPKKTDLIPLDNSNCQDELIVDKIISNAQLIREAYEKRKAKKELSNVTFKNKLSTTPKFLCGDLVLHRQMQVSTGTSTKWKPLFTGPFIINEINKSQRTAVCQNTTSGKTIKAHFNNLVKYECRPALQLTPPK
jgi:hypothetical protein